MSNPTSLTLRTYQVGFGDCFLLTFHYPSPTGDRHILIDFGSTRAPNKLLAKLPAALPKQLKKQFPGLKTPVSASKHMELVAEDIAVQSGGKLHVVVATHRHKDHISGFATNTEGTASGNIIRRLKPDLVVLPWTEHPKAKTDAEEAPSTIENTRAFVSSLAAMNSFADAIEKEATRLIKLRAEAGRKSTPTLNSLQFMGENSIANKSAIKNLMTMGRKVAYVNFGSREGKSALHALLPGITTHILGPPTLVQSEAIRTQRSRDNDEFWTLAATAASRFVAGGELLFRDAEVSEIPPHAVWLTTRMDRMRLQSMSALVRVLDDAMNNTSVILLFEAGKARKKFLFPGDAQIENWLYALSAAPVKERNQIRKLLMDVDLYKVGHHGSLNATPKTLWGLFEHRSSDVHAGRRLSTVVSTKSGVHGRTEATRVPRTKLINALRHDSNLQNTNASQQFFLESKFDLQ